MPRSNSTAYLGNKKLKAEGVKQTFTLHELQEYQKCAEDPIYFIENYVKIISLDKGEIYFNLWDFQREIIKTFMNYRFCIVKCPRQVGKSLVTCAFLLWMILFKEQQNIAILANKFQTAQKLLSDLKKSYMGLPMWMQQGVVEWNKRNLELENGCKIMASSTSSDAIRGNAFNLIFLDEFAFVPPHLAEEFFDSVYPTITSGETTKVFIVSCVSKDTYVITNKGIAQVKDFVDFTKTSNPKIGYAISPYFVLGAKGLNPGSCMVNSGVAKTKIITTSSSSLECSLNHKLWACKNGTYDWYPASELTTNDYLSIRYGDNIWGNYDSLSDISIEYSSKEHNRFVPPQTMTKSLAYFMGLFLAEGSSYKVIHNENFVGGNITLTCGDNIEQAFHDIGVSYSSYDNLHYTASSKSLYNFLKSYGFDLSLKANLKIIPSRILSSSKPIVASFLRGFFDGDGCIKNRRGDISVVSSSPVLIDQIRILLMNFGILTQKYTGVTPPTKLVHVSSDYYRLEISSYEHKQKFLNEIGFGLSRKQTLANKVIQHQKKLTKDVIPYGRLVLKEANIKCDAFLSWTSHKSRELCLELPGVQNLSHIINKNIKWERIRNITNSETEVYDFSLDHIENDFWCHSVAYNGIIGHQTPKGMNKFHKMWVEANHPHNSQDPTIQWNGYEPISINWRDVPKPDGTGKRDDEWKKQTVARTSEQQFRQEFESVYGDVYITVKDRITGKCFHNSIQELYDKFENQAQVTNE